MALYIVTFPGTAAHDSYAVTARGYEAALASAASEAGFTYAGLVEEGRDRPTADQRGARYYTARHAARGQYLLNHFRATVDHCR